MSEKEQSASLDMLSAGHARIKHLRTYMPGVVLCATVAMAAQFIGEHYGGPVILLALLLGMAFNQLAEDTTFERGIEFCARSLLRFGVALLGVQISFDQLQTIGSAPYVLVLISVPSVIGFSFLVGKVLNFNPVQSLIAGIAVAICGVAAVLAVLAAIPKTKQDVKHSLCILVGVTGVSTCCMLLYPLLAGSLGIQDDGLGLFLGATIHDIAQVVGAGYLVSDHVGDVAIFTKMLRVSLLVVLVLLVSLYYRKQAVPRSKGISLPIPAFLIGFMSLMILVNTVDVAQPLVDELGHFSRLCLLLTIAALGVKTQLVAMVRKGWKSLIHLICNTLFLAALTLLLLQLY
ncbi:MAG: putative sulfate exporter family transporter [Ketobacter sp.]